MCILPNIQAQYLEELSERRKNRKKTESETLKIIIPSYKSLENSIKSANKV
jgi:hypothetical protein